MPTSTLCIPYTPVIPKYAWVLDKLKVKYECGTTIDKFCGSLKLPNSTAPSLMPWAVVIPSWKQSHGRHGLTPMLIVAEDAGESEASSSEVSQTREHMHQTYTLGVKSLISNVKQVVQHHVSLQWGLFWLSWKGS